MEFSRQENWSGLLFPSLGDHPDPGIVSRPPTSQADSLPLSHQGSPVVPYLSYLFQSLFHIYGEGKNCVLFVFASLVSRRVAISYFFYCAIPFYFLFIFNGLLLYSIVFVSTKHQHQFFFLMESWTEEPGGLWSMGSLRFRHAWATSLSLFTFMHWRRKWQPTPVFLPGESQGRRSLVGCHLWGRTESDTTEAT